MRRNSKRFVSCLLVMALALALMTGCGAKSDDIEVKSLGQELFPETTGLLDTLKMVQEGQYKVNAYEYKGECWRIDSVQSFFKLNMDLLNPEKRKGIFRDELPVYTKVRDEMPTYYGDNASVINSLLADGCQIEGTVENSILFRGVRVAPDAHVKNCIIMQDGQVHSGAYIENCILDKQSVIKRNAKLIGPDAYPIVIAKNVMI